MFSDTLTMQDVKDVFENGSEDEENENDENQKEMFREAVKKKIAEKETLVHSSILIYPPPSLA